MATAIKTLAHLAPFIDPQIIAIAWVSIFIVVLVHVVRLTWGRPRPLLA